MAPWQNLPEAQEEIQEFLQKLKEEPDPLLPLILEELKRRKAASQTVETVNNTHTNTVDQVPALASEPAAIAEEDISIAMFSSPSNEDNKKNQVPDTPANIEDQRQVERHRIKFNARAFCGSEDRKTNSESTDEEWAKYVMLFNSGNI